MANQNGIYLLDYAVSKLSPDIFMHPVWVRFGKDNRSSNSGVVENLLSVSKKLQKDDPGDACQLLLICTVYRNHADRYKDALKIVQQALALAEHANLAKETAWCAWGATAACFQGKNYEQAAKYLAYLQEILNRQNDWVLADFVDIIKQSLPRSVKGTAGKQIGKPRVQPLDDTLTLAFDWLKQWGFSHQPAEMADGSTREYSLNSTTIQVLPDQPITSVQHWKRYWRNLILALTGRPIQQSIKNYAQQTLSLPIRSGSPVKQGANPQVFDGTPQPASISIPISERAGSPIDSTSQSRCDSSVEQLSANKTTAVVVQMLGLFNIIMQDSGLKLPNSRGLSLLKYLLLHYKQDTPREVLMDIFWPEANPESARNNLNVAMHHLRQVLRSVTDLPLIRFEAGAYGVETNLDIWLDVEEFERCVKDGQRLELQNQSDAAITEYEIAVNLYQGDFLTDNPYESWTVLDRERLRIAFLDTLDHLSQIYFREERYAQCANLCQRILNRDLCREDAHCRLMRCYSRLGQGPLALRQYQICAEALRTELEIDPAPETTQLYVHIRHHARV